ncbi:MAG TPA: alpha/beta hydrolase [Chloroflexota bacterium]|nr:alpha/beta hydrolase [Chloroflexota bacterium]
MSFAPVCRSSGLRSLLTLTVLVSAGAVTPWTPARAAAMPTFAGAVCPFKVGAGLVAGKDVRCGYVTVPERHEVTGGRAIQIAVAIFKGAGDLAHPDPVISLQGGPGGAWLSQLGPLITRATLPALVGSHDLILVDQRGAGASKPSLDCPELTRLKYRLLTQNLPPARYEPLTDAAILACRARLVGEGIDLAAYTTAENAADIEDVITALRYRQVDLYGASYGTKLALAAMRAFPQHIRAVVLDSVVPIQSDLQVEGVANAAAALHRLFAGCAAQLTCNAAYPRLDRTFDALVAKLNATPEMITATNPADNRKYTVPLTGDRLVDFVIASLTVSEAIYLIPAVLHAASRGNFVALALLYNVVSFDDTVSLGMYFSVECGEDAPVITSAALAGAVKGFTPAARPGQLREAQDFPRACAQWRMPPVNPTFRTPVISAIPTLLLAGQYDPITSLEDARRVARTLGHATVVLFPGSGHGVALSGSDCPLSLMMAFYDQPTARLNTACTAGMGATFLVRG